MSEIEKMYENARAYYFRYDCDVFFKDGNFGRITNCSKGEIKDYCTDKKYFKKAKVINVRHLYPPFTAEKQIKLIEFFISSIWWKNLKSLHRILDCSLKFEDKLAKMVNYLWLSLTEEEKKQVKGILE